MATISLIKNETNSQDKLPLEGNFYHGKIWLCHTDEQVFSVETDHSHFFIIGYIQDNQFLNSPDKARYFDDACIIENITRFNGHFSLIKVSKTTDEFTVYTNKSGGHRVYLKPSFSAWLISNSLTPLLENDNRINSTALEELLFYRWITGENSLVEGVHQIPSGHYWQIANTTIVEKQCYFTLPNAKVSRTSSQSLTELATNAEQLLALSLNRMLKPNKKVAVLLSGGVDSSILAAIAHHAGHQLVAISHRSLQHENPELDTAIKFAKTLNIEHRIIDIDDNQVAEAFKQCTLITEQAPRYQSSIILFLLFSKLEGEFSQVIYGEAADTLFGNNALKRYLNRYQKQQKVKKITDKLPLFKIVNKLIPKTSKLALLINETVEDYIRQTNELAINSQSVDCYSRITQLSHSNYSLQRLSKEQVLGDELSNNLLKIKRFVLDTDVDNHFHETGALAAHFGLELVSPFVDIDIINFSAHLTLEHTLTSAYVKPILRKIGEKYFTPELMYLPKKGFPAPHKTWLATCLQDYVKQAATEMEFLPVKQLDPETQWTIAALHILLTNMGITLHTSD